MTKLDKKTILQIANLSSIQLNSQEVDILQEQLSTILEYVQQLQQVEKTSQADQIRNINLFRLDEAHLCADAHLIREQAPERQENYFVVPTILED